MAETSRPTTVRNCYRCRLSICYNNSRPLADRLGHGQTHHVGKSGRSVIKKNTGGIVGRRAHRGLQR